jgi:lysophospholipase L1-like esterase
VAEAVPRGLRRRRLALLGCSLLVSLLFAEGAVRLLGLAGSGRGSPWFAGGNHPRFLVQPDPDSGYRLRPGFVGRQVAPAGEFEVPVVVDALGLRDHAHAAPPRPVVLALGDSMTFGEGVGAEEAWPAVLERAAGLRVYAAGVPGFGSPQMAAELARLGPRLRPDLVLVALSPRWDRQRCAEPFRYLGGYIVGAGYAGKLHLIDGNLYLADVRWPLVGPATAHLKRRSHLARLALPALRRAAGALAGEGAAGRRDPDAGRVEPTVRALLEIRRRAAALGAPVLVLLLDSRGPEFEADRDALLAALLAREVPVVAADELLAGRSWEPLRYPRDGHWNAAGHRAVGEALAPVVRRAMGRRAARPVPATAPAPAR